MGGKGSGSKKRPRICTYCGSYGDEQDHLFARGLRGARKRDGKGIGYGKVVLSCSECNRALRNLPLFTIYDRAYFLLQYYCLKWKYSFTEEQIARIDWLRNVIENNPII